ncbi:Protein GrpE [Dyadobacter sp. CECT 9275]|uniref:Protein GrpE n=1 Tax=Dyadobacter helix TaxID=2822344 RepID=A0A916JHE3_9BACT|nr:nucleotide exchange factor GrpE [Dyadobacter sp. CECT 9275]CAG5004139.1 Protein GrpE [Dyadobacter sp. CECT 9275]
MPENTEYNLDKEELNEDTDKITSEGEIIDAEFATAEEEAPQEKNTDESHKAEVAELKEKYLRLYADFENFRRRTAKEKLEMISGAGAEMMKAVLPVVDDFERAKVSFDSSTDIDALREGVDLIYTKLLKTLESKGLKAMASKGESFDADLHESIAQFPAPSDDLKGKVIDEIEKGYYLNDKVIRYAKVIVGS